MTIVTIVDQEIGTSMKYFNSFALYFCAAATGIQLAAHNYKLAAINFLGIIFFFFAKNARRDEE